MNRLAEEDRPLALNPTGTIVQTIDQIKYGYDPVDELVSRVESSPADPVIGTTNYTYDGFNRLIEKNQFFTPNEGAGTGDDSVYTYSPQLDAIRLVTANNATANLNFSWEAAPPYAGTNYGVQATDPANSLGLIQDSYTVTREVTGNISSIQNLASQILYQAHYDPAGRLTQASGGLDLSNPAMPFLMRDFLMIPLEGRPRSRSRSHTLKRFCMTRPIRSKKFVGRKVAPVSWMSCRLMIWLAISVPSAEGTWARTSHTIP